VKCFTNGLEPGEQKVFPPTLCFTLLNLNPILVLTIAKEPSHSARHHPQAHDMKTSHENPLNNRNSQPHIMTIRPIRKT